MSNPQHLGKETIAMLYALKQIGDQIEALRKEGAAAPANIQVLGKYYYDSQTISKASTFTDTDVDIEGFNLVQISSDGDLRNVSYRVRKSDANLTPTIEASLNPHITGFAKRVLVTNDTAEAGKTVFIEKFLVQPGQTPSIWHGSSQPGSGSASEARFTPIAKGRIFNTTVNSAAEFFSSELSPTFSPTLFRTLISLAATARLRARADNGVIAFASSLNGTSSVTLNTWYMFDLLARSGDTWNFDHTSGTSVRVQYMLVDEIPAGTQ